MAIMNQGVGLGLSSTVVVLTSSTNKGKAIKIGIFSGAELQYCHPFIAIKLACRFSGSALVRKEKVILRTFLARQEYICRPHSACYVHTSASGAKLPHVPSATLHPTTQPTDHRRGSRHQPGSRVGELLRSKRYLQHSGARKTCALRI